LISCSRSTEDGRGPTSAVTDEANMKSGELGPFPETAAELLARARATPSPVGEYGYFLAKSGELFGNRELADKCKEFWLRCVAPGYEPGTGDPAEGVSAWRSRSGDLVVFVVARDASTGRIAATRLSALASTDFPCGAPG
jgi:hypothetical protein